MWVVTEGKHGGQLCEGYIGDWHLSGFFEMVSKVIGELAALSKSVSAYVTGERPSSSVNELMLLVVLFGAEDFEARGTLKLVVVWVAISRMSAYIVFGSINARTSGEGTLEATLFGTC